MSAHLPLQHQEALFVGGTWSHASSGAKIPIINPATEEVVGHCAAANERDVDHAVRAASKAWPAWADLSGAERAVHLRRIAAAVEADTKCLAELEALDMGKPIAESTWDVEDVAGAYKYYANLAEALDERQNTPVKLSMEQFDCKLRYEAAGVIGIIVPWNYPLLMATWKVAPALAAGCTVVLKPSEHSSLTAIRFAELVDQLALPAGVFNLVTGYGHDCGEALVTHPNIDAIAFTGSTRVGSMIMGKAAKFVRQCSLELGGKSSLIVFDDVDVDQAVEWIMFGVFWTNGQICSSTSRVLLHRNIADKVLDRLKEEVEKIKIGDPLDPTSKLGPVVNKQQYEKVMEYIRLGRRDARLLCGGNRSPDHEKGYFIQPTVFLVDKDSSTTDVWNEEIFGPVLSIKIFDREAEAIREANNTEYGLAGAVMSLDLARCERVAKALMCGIVWVNCSQPCFVEAPWGGRKKSGIGRDLGQYGMDRFLEVKQVTTYKTPHEPWGWYIAKL